MHSTRAAPTPTGYLREKVASAYLGGTVDLLSQRVVEVLMSFPTLVLAMVFLVALGGAFGR